MRDSQRQRLYDAERAAFGSTSGRRDGTSDPGLAYVRRFATVEEAQRYVDRIERSAWFRRWFPWISRHTKVRESTRAYRFATGGRGEITLPAARGRKWGHVDWIVLHELCHNLMADGGYVDCAAPAGSCGRHVGPGAGTHYRTLASHGPEFARLYVDAVERWMGVQAAVRLRHALRNKRCRIANRRDVYHPSALRYPDR